MSKIYLTDSDLFQRSSLAVVQTGIYSSPAPDSSDPDSETMLFLTDQFLTVVKGSHAFSKARTWDLFGLKSLC